MHVIRTVVAFRNANKTLVGHRMQAEIHTVNTRVLTAKERIKVKSSDHQCKMFVFVMTIIMTTGSGC